MVSAVVLAAGLSSRMGGRPKALLAFDERDSFVTRIVRTFADAGVSDIVVVVGHEADAVTAAVQVSGLPARCIFNAAYVSGQLSSMIAGLDAVESRMGVRDVTHSTGTLNPDRADAVVLALVDAPAFAASTVKALIARFEVSRLPVVRAVRGDEHGHPVLLARQLFDPIRHADPSRGAKPIVRAHASAAGDVAVDDAGAFVDVDTPERYQALQEQLRRGAFAR